MTESKDDWVTGKAKIGLRGGSFLWQKLLFPKSVKKSKFSPKVCNFSPWAGYELGGKWDQNFTSRPWNLLKLLTNFDIYISHTCKNQLTPKKTTASQTNFDFTNMGLEVLSFRVMTLRKGKFWIGSPCTYLQHVTNCRIFVLCTL